MMLRGSVIVSTISELTISYTSTLVLLDIALKEIPSMLKGNTPLRLLQLDACIVRHLFPFDPRVESLSLGQSLTDIGAARQLLL